MLYLIGTALEPSSENYTYQYGCDAANGRGYVRMSECLDCNDYLVAFLQDQKDNIIASIG